MNKITQNESNSLYNKIAKYLNVQNLGGRWNTQQNIDRRREMVDNICYDIGFTLTNKIKRKLIDEGPKELTKFFKFVSQEKGIKNAIPKGKLSRTMIIEYLEPFHGKITLEKIQKKWGTDPNFSFNIRQATEYVDSLLSSGKRYKIKYKSNKWFVLNQKTKDALIGIITNALFVYDLEKYSDDTESIEYTIDRGEFLIEEFIYEEPRNAPNNKGGIGFFKKVNNLKHVDLSRYQIYHKINNEEDLKKNNYEYKR
jgi:hypothetical protein